MTREHPGLKKLVGREVSSIEFVRGYVQMRFDGPCLSAYTMPMIRASSGQELGPQSVGYEKALVQLVGRSVELAVHDDAAILIRFAGGPELLVSLADSDRRAVEAATLDAQEAQVWSW